MIVVDTRAFVWWVSESSRLSATARRRLADERDERIRQHRDVQSVP